MVIDKLSKKFNINLDKEDFEGLIGKGEIAGEKVMLVKPQTYMNLSGECVSQIINFYKLDVSDLIVIYDDIDISLGKIKIRPYGSSGTHNGMRNIISLLNSDKFIRIRVGTDKPTENIGLADYVLMKLNKDEIEKLDVATENATSAISEILENGCQSAMNLYN
jgi:PTH1 family peptidyl-tRNA hydrolase